MSTDDQGSDLEVVDLVSQVDPAPLRSRLTPPSAQQRGRWWRRWWVWAIPLLLLGLWIALALTTLLDVRGDVAAARERLLAGRDALVDGDVPAAVEDFDRAADDLGAVPERVGSPLLEPLRLYRPWRATLEAVVELGEAGSVAAGAARDVAAQIATNEGGLGALTPRDGRIPIGEVAALAPVLADAAERMEQAREQAERIVVFRVDEQVLDGRQEFLDLVGPTAEQLRLGSRVAEVLPQLFGAEGARRYLVVASNPAESRGTGGFLGAYTVLEAEDGRLTFGPVQETQDLPIPPDGSVEWGDPSLAQRYDLYGGSSRIRSMNMTPDFPAAAATMENYWAAVQGEPLDGVISVDPFAFEALLSISGPVDLGVLGEVSAEEVVEFVTYEAYDRVEVPALRKRLIGNVATEALRGFLNGPGDISPGDVLQALGAMVRRDSLLIHATRPEEQAVLVEAGLAGEFASGTGDLLAVINNSGSGSKIDYFLQRTVRYDVELVDDGAVNGVVSAGFVNTAPVRGELTYMIGPPEPGVPFGAGDNVLFTSVYCAPGCEFFETPDVGYADLPTTTGVELGFPVASTWMLIPSMRAQELVYSYRAPDAWTVEEDLWVYRLHYEHQTAVRPTSVEVRIDVPAGREPVDLPAEARVADEQVVISFDATTDQDLLVVFAPA